MAVEGLSGALDQWRSVLGRERVLVDATELSLRSRATHPTRGALLGSLRPASRDQVGPLLAIASRYRVPIYPSSCGKSWGLGSRTPPRDAVLLDLGDLTRISNFNERLGSIEVEPGVTFAQLYDFLKAARSRFFLNVTGSSPHSSVLANAIERGDGAGPYGERFAHVCNLEVTLATGEVLRTGFGNFQGGAKSGLAAAHRWGVGPSLDGLFSQSNLGVVTRLCLWLRPLPRSLHVLRFGLENPARLGKLCDALAELRLEGTLDASVGIWNDYRVVSTVTRFPADTEDAGRPLSRAALERMPEWPGERWSATTAIYSASPELGHAKRLHVERCLAPLVDGLSVTEASGDALVGRELLHPAEPAFKFLQGIPHEHSIASAYWRKPPAAPGVSGPPPPNGQWAEALDLDADACGVMWVCAALPFTGEHLVKAVRVAEQRLPEFGFEPLIAAVAQSERAIYFVPLMVYDRDTAGADERALRCHDALYAEYAELGYLPYRLGSQSMGQLPTALDDRVVTLRRLKRALDPAGVLAPGRYDWSDGE